jgi:hypothetical protein
MISTKSILCSFIIPAKAGIYGRELWHKRLWAPAFAWMMDIPGEISPCAIVPWTPL